jgi:H+/gluconate symporter-like permease
VGIAVIVLMIAQLRPHPFLSLTIGSIGVVPSQECTCATR